MPEKKAKSPLFTKYLKDMQAAHEAHKSDEVEFSNFGDLPEGIDHGIAQLDKCYFDTYKTGDNIGEPFFYASGIVKSPKEVVTEEGKIPVYGLRTKIMSPMFPTPDRARKTVEDHVKWVYNQLHLLGLDTTNLKLTDLETAMAALQSAQPYFRFRTWKGKPSKEFPNPKVNETWNGQCEFNEEDDMAGVEDASGLPDSVPPEGQDFEEGATVDDGIPFLVEKANNGEEEAQLKLGELAMNAGASQAEVSAAKDWEAVAALITNVSEVTEEHATQGEEPETEEATDAVEEGPKVPEVESVYKIFPLDPKTKKPGKKGIQVEVIAVDEDKQTVDLKDLNNPKLRYNKVPWARLQQPD